MAKRRPSTDFSALMSGVPNLSVLTTPAPIEEDSVESPERDSVTHLDSMEAEKAPATAEVVQTNEVITHIPETKTPNPPQKSIDDIGVFLELLKTPSIYRSKGYASHMCSTGAEDALRNINKVMADECGLRTPLQDRYIWNLGLMVLSHGIDQLTKQELSHISAVTSANSEDLILHRLFNLIKERLEN